MINQGISPATTPGASTRNTRLPAAARAVRTESILWWGAPTREPRSGGEGSDVVPTDGTTPSELEACLAFLRAMHARGAERVERFRDGAAYLCDSLPQIYSLTFLELDRGVERPQPTS